MAGFIPQYIIFLGFILLRNAAKVQFFSEPNFKGSMHEADSSENCTNLSKKISGAANSLKTTVCIAIFSEEDCDTRTYHCVTRSYERRLVDWLSYSGLYDGPITRSVKSIRDCTDMERRLEADIDVSGKLDGAERGTLLQFRDVCGCRNIPGPPLNYFKANTFGKCFTFYGTSDCSGERIPAITLPGLFNWFYYTPSSFTPCEIPSHCIRLEASIYKLDQITNISTLMNAVRETSMAATSKQILTNNGRGTMNKLYEASKEVNEMSQFEFSNALKNTSSVSFDGSLEVGMDVSLPFVGSVIEKFKAGAGISSQNESSSTTTKKFEIKNRRLFKVAVTIHVPPCTKYNVSSNVEILENVGINFKVQAKITGKTITGQQLLADEIQTHLKGQNLTYLRGNGDNFTVFVETTAQLKVKTHGLRSDFDAIDEQIPDCLERNKHLICELTG